MRTSILLVLAALVPWLAGVAQPSGGLIAYGANYGVRPAVYVMSPDGLTHYAAAYDAKDPAFTPDGRMLAFVRGADIWVANVDGSHPRQVTQHGLGVQVSHPSFSADGQTIIFAMAPVVPEPVFNLYLVGVDGNNERMVAEDGLDPVYTPDGVQILFARGADVWGMMTNSMGGPAYTPAPVIQHGLGVTLRAPSVAANAPGTLFTLRPVVPNPVPYLVVHRYADNTEVTLAQDAAQGSYRPDGGAIVFVRAGDLWVMNSDGTGQRQLTSGPANANTPAWH